MIAAAGLPGFRMYDLRHHAVTVLLENADVSEETAEAIAGHISHRMKKRYSHVRLAARRAAVSVLDGSSVAGPSETARLRPRDGLGNADVIEMLQADSLPPKVVIEKIRKTRNCCFDTSRETLKTLKSSGVPESVLVAMVRAS